MSATALQQSDDPLNITCDIPPPSAEDCDKIPICGPFDYNHTSSICRPELSVSSCIAGFMYVNPTNPITKPPKHVKSLDQLPAGSTSAQAPCYKKDWPYTRACCPGFYCPTNLYCMIPCDLDGSYCPSSDTVKFPDCDPVINILNLTSETVSYPELMGCGGSIQSDTLCPKGSFCSNSSLKIGCPVGYFCRSGYPQPIDCPFLMDCSKYASSQPLFNVVALVLFILIFGVITGCLSFMKLKNYKLCPSRKASNVDIKIDDKSKYSHNYLSTLFARQSMSENVGSINSKNKQYIHPKKQNKYLLNSQTHTHTDDDEKYSKKHTLSSDVNTRTLEQSRRTHNKFSDSVGVNTIYSSLLIPKQNKNNNKNSMDIKAKNLDFMIDIEFKNLSLTLKSNGKCILNKCTGYFGCGTLNAIMGPSGAGKTTLLNTLSGKALSYGKISGELLINGDVKSIADFKDIVGFVPQNDSMTPEMTVKEMLEFNAKFRLSKELSRDYRKSVVVDVMKLLKIYHIRNSLIGNSNINDDRGISGGQQKRVNIGMELVSQPSVLFLDEPTSGLDATTATDILKILKLIASRGTLVICVLHQPRYEIYSQFDNVMLLTNGGNTVYNGDTSKSLNYFSDMGYIKPQFVNPADFILDIISGIVENKKYNNQQIDFHQKWLNADKNKYNLIKNKNYELIQKDNNDYTNRIKLNCISQIWLCFHRSITIHLRQKYLIAADIFLICLAGFVVGFIVDSTDIQKVPSSCQFTIMAASIIGTIISLRIFGNDRLMYWRFSSVGINRFSYFIGSCLTSLSWIFLEPLIFLICYWPMAVPHGSFIDYFFILFLGMFVVQGIGHSISVIVDPNKSILVSVVFVMIFNFLNGFQPSLTSLNSSILGKMVTTCIYSRWQQEGIFNKEIGSWPEVYTSQRNLQHTLYGWKGSNKAYALDISMMIIIGFVFRIITYLALRYLNKARQL